MPIVPVDRGTSEPEINYGLYGGLPEYNGGKIPGVSLPNPRNRNRLTSVYSQQRQQAGDYLANMRGNSDRAFQSYANDSQLGLNKTIKRVKNDYNSRGLLNSGLQGNSVAEARTNANKDLDQKRSELNAGILGNLNMLEGNSFDTASMLAQPGPNVSNNFLTGVASNIAADQADSALNGMAVGQIGQGAGALGGYGLASLLAKGKEYQPAPKYYDYNALNDWASRTA